jgi:hypothetical protein
MRVGRGLSGCLLALMLVGGLFFGLVFLGFAFVLTKLDGGPSPLPFAAAGIGGMLILWGLSFALYRGYHPRRDRSLEATVDRARVKRGGAVLAGVASGGGEQDIELGLVCRVVCDTWRTSPGALDNSGPTRITTSAVVSERWVPAQLGHAELTVPCNGPYSHEGQSVSFAWGVHARRVGERIPPAATPIWVTP